MTMMNELRVEANRVILSVGDMIHEVRTGSKGFLQARERRIDMVKDDIYIWSIIWFAQSEGLDQFNNPIFMEEEGLKMSIIVGTVVHHKATKGDNNE